MENSNWKEFYIEDFAEIVNHKRIPLSTLERTNRKGSFPYYGASGIIDYVDNYIFEGKHILVSEDGENLRSRNTPIAFQADGRFWVNNHAHILKCKKDFYNEILIYYFQNLDLNPFLTGAVQPKLNKASLTKIPIILPADENHQKAIASVLSSLDDKIDLLHQQNQTLEALAETLYLNFIGEREFNSKLSDIFSLQNGYAFKSKSFKESGIIRVIKIKNISGDIVDITNSDFVDDESIKKLDVKFKINSGDILIAMTGAVVGKLGIVPETDQSLWLNQRVGSIKQKFEGAKYLVYLHLKSDFGQDYIENTATGSAQPNISGEGIENCEFPLYEEAELEEICNKLSPLYDKVIFNLGQIQTLTKLRDTLLPKLMSGEVRVKI